MKAFQTYIQHHLHDDHFHQKWNIFSITFKKWHSKHFITVYQCNCCSIINNITIPCTLDNNKITIRYISKSKTNIMIILAWFNITQFSNFSLSFNTLPGVFDFAFPFEEVGVSSTTSIWTDLSPFCLFSTEYIFALTNSDVITEALF